MIESVRTLYDAQTLPEYPLASSFNVQERRSRPQRNEGVGDSGLLLLWAAAAEAAGRLLWAAAAVLLLLLIRPIADAHTLDDWRYAQYAELYQFSRIKWGLGVAGGVTALHES